MNLSASASSSHLRRTGCRLLAGLVLLTAGVGLNSLRADEPNRGPWQSLFDGTSLRGMHLYNRGELTPQRWTVRDGELWLHSLNEQPDGRTHEDLVITSIPWTDFELEFDWKIEITGNSGVFYKVIEDARYEKAWATGLEYQLLDNQGAEDNKVASHLAGSIYDLVAAARDVTRPPGSWNQGRIVVAGSHLEQWLNGILVLSADDRSPEWRRAIAASKFSQLPTFAPKGPGLIVLQDHGNAVGFRHLRIRKIATPAKG